MNGRVAESLRTLLILGRVSNLPTVWSNCLAAWMLAQGGGILHPNAHGWVRLLAAMLGCSLLYVAGMVLNDAFDVKWDAVHRPERPIPSGRIQRRTVAMLGTVLLAGGLCVLIPISGLWACALAGTILLYNLIHKHLWVGLPLMAGCRALIYPSVGAGLWFPPLQFAALFMACWILLISVLAATETTPRSLPRLLTLPLLVVPATLAFRTPDYDCFNDFAIAVIPWLAFLAWRIVPKVRKLTSANLVPDLLAAIPLVDLAIVAPLRSGNAGLIEQHIDYLPFLALTAAALIWRRTIPPS